MALATYTDLLAAITSHCKDTTGVLTASLLADFVSLAEATVNDELRLPAQVTTSSLTLTSGTSSVTQPSDFLEVISLNYTDGQQWDLNPATYDVIDQNVYLSSPARPSMYAITADSIVFNRVSDATYTLLLRYYKSFDIASTSTNWLLTNSPNIYLYGCIAQAELWRENYPKAQLYKKMFDEEIEGQKIVGQRTRGRALSRVDPALVSRGAFNINTGLTGS